MGHYGFQSLSLAGRRGFAQELRQVVARPSPTGRRWPEGPDEGVFAGPHPAFGHPLPVGEGTLDNVIHFCAKPAVGTSPSHRNRLFLSSSSSPRTIFANNRLARINSIFTADTDFRCRSAISSTEHSST